MTTETQEQVETNVEDNGNVQWATKADVERLESKIEWLMSRVSGLEVGQKWIAWVLGGMSAMLVAIFCALIAIALQI